jgi:type IV secretion system protein VirB4
MFSLAEYRKHPARLADLLLWVGLIAPGVVLNKDGTLQQTLRFRGPDLESSTAAELTALAARLNNVLKRLTSGWALFIEAQRYPSVAYPHSTWPDPVSLLIDEERRARFAESGTFYDSAYYLTLTYLPPSEQTHGVRRLLYEHLPERQLDYRDTLSFFQDQVARWCDLLADVVPMIVPLDDAETLTYLHTTISTKRHPIAVPEVPIYLDAQLPDMDFTGGVRPKLGPSFLRPVTIRAFPNATFPGIVDALNHLGLAYRYVIRYLALDKLDALREIKRYERQWLAKRKTLLTLLREAITHTESALVNSDAANNAEDANAAHQEAAADLVAYGYCTATVIVWDEDPARAEEKVQLVERVINGQGFTTHAEDLNAVEAWLGSLPGHVYANVRRPLLHSLNLAHLLPISAVWAGPERNDHLQGPPLLYATSSGSTPFRLVLHQGDVGHTLIIGPTGAGKSVLLALIAVQFRRYPGAQVYIFDKGGSARAVTTGVGGDYYDLGGAQASLAFQPLRGIDVTYERAWATEWIEGLLIQEGVTLTPAVKDEVWQALGSLATAPPAQRTLTGLVHLLQHTPLRHALRPYTLDGPHGPLLDADTESLTDGTWQCFEMAQLLQTPRVVPPVLTYLFHRLDQRLTGPPTLLILDEAWLFLDHPLFAARIREWLKTLRKANTSVLFATQSLADVATSSIAAAVTESCPTRIFLPNGRALEAQVAAFYRSYGFNDRQIHLLATATPKRQYYYVSPQGNRLFELELGEVALTFCGASQPDDLALIDRVTQTHGPAFPQAFLHAKGLPWAAALVAEGQQRDHRTVHTAEYSPAGDHPWEGRAALPASDHIPLVRVPALLTSKEAQL